MRLLATPDHSPKTAGAVHPVYQFEALADAAGNAREASDGATTLKGIVACLHYAKHGEPTASSWRRASSSISGRTRMQAAKLEVGSKVTATGHTRPTVLGTTLLEASRVNRIDIE